MYIRTKNGEIFDCYESEQMHKPIYYLKKSKCNGYIHYEDVYKKSDNIVDILEVGDYVNGLKITLINEPSMANCNKRLLYAEDEEGYLIKMFDKQDIKSIVTKEQFEAMQYKVGE